MTQFANAMEVFKLLEKSNCRKCNSPTCLTFAASVFKGEKNLSECVQLDEKIIEKYSGKQGPPPRTRDDMDEKLQEMKGKISGTNLEAIADRLGGTLSGDRLTLKVMGKDFNVDSDGNLSSEIHINPWVAAPFIDYIINGKGVAPSGNWVPLRELEGGKTWYRLFGQMCEKPLKDIADTYTDLFEDMIQIFNGRQVEKHYQSDISLVLSPLPKVPMLICYWKPEDGLESSLNLFFDDTAEENIHIESIYTLGTGLVNMFKKIALRHGIK